MDTPVNIRPPRFRTSVETSPARIEVTGGGQRRVEICVVIFLGLLVWWPFVILAIAVVLPTLAVLVVLAAVLAAIALPPWMLVRRLRGRHPAQQSTPS